MRVRVQALFDDNRAMLREDVTCTLHAVVSGGGSEGMSWLASALLPPLLCRAQPRLSHVCEQHLRVLSSSVCGDALGFSTCLWALVDDFRLETRA